MTPEKKIDELTQHAENIRLAKERFPDVICDSLPDSQIRFTSASVTLDNADVARSDNDGRTLRIGTKVKDIIVWRTALMSEIWVCDAIEHLLRKVNGAGFTGVNVSDPLPVREYDTGLSAKVAELTAELKQLHGDVSLFKPHLTSADSQKASDAKDIIIANLKRENAALRYGR